jgi:hypothetical protein
MLDYLPRLKAREARRERIATIKIIIIFIVLLAWSSLTI